MAKKNNQPVVVPETAEVCETVEQTADCVDEACACEQGKCRCTDGTCGHADGTCACGKNESTAEAAAVVPEWNAETDPLVETRHLKMYFPVQTNFWGKPTRYLKAVDNVNIAVKKGRTLGIVGESGCGKTTMGRTILRLYDVTDGEIYFKGREVSKISNREFDKLRPNMQMIFQDPYASLSPRLSVGEIIGEAALEHGIVDKAHYREYVIDVMKMCGLQPHYYDRYPHEFSGGQRQRICIARALALKPDLVICDEPVSALDVSIQAQIINMLRDLQRELGLTYVFISHDLSVVKHISDEVGVMYLGSMVEYGLKEDIFAETLHPYTKALFSAVPLPNPHVKMNRIILRGDIPSPANPPKGCKFHTRCDSCMHICEKVAPAYREVKPGHFCACHLYDDPSEIEAFEEAERVRKEAEAKAAEEARLAGKPIPSDSDENKKFDVKAICVTVGNWCRQTWGKVCDLFRKSDAADEKTEQNEASETESVETVRDRDVE